MIHAIWKEEFKKEKIKDTSNLFEFSFLLNFDLNFFSSLTFQNNYFDKFELLRMCQNRTYIVWNFVKSVELL